SNLLYAAMVQVADRVAKTPRRPSARWQAPVNSGRRPFEYSGFEVRLRGIKHRKAEVKRLSSRVLFIQATNPGAYPPIIHASTLMAEVGWEVTLLSAPIADDALALAPHPSVKIHAIRTRPSHVMSGMSYALYVAAAARLALRLRPNIVYASDPLGAGPGLLAARLSGAGLVYHEHDSPSPGMRPVLAWCPPAPARAPQLVVFPNEHRANFAQSELQFSNNRLRIVWNVPRRAELASSTAPAEPPLIVYYHGSITPERLPETVALAVRRMTGRVLLRIA